MNLAEKKPHEAYQINLEAIKDGWVYDIIICHAHNHNEARSTLLHKVRWDGMKLRSGEDLTYLNIPVQRCPGADLVAYEGKLISKHKLEEIKARIKRHTEFDDILADPGVIYCYIKKYGSYYSPGYSGYTHYVQHAGVYTKEDAVSHARGCDEIWLVPVDIQAHNARLKECLAAIERNLITV